MSAYANDPRVRPVGSDAWYVTIDGHKARVMRVSGGRFEAATDPERLDNPTFATADEAIRFLVGGPQ